MRQTFIEIQRAHGVAHHRVELAQLLTAPKQLLGQAVVQVGVADHQLPQDQLLEFGHQFGIHRLFGNNNCSRLKP